MRSLRWTLPLATSIVLLGGAASARADITAIALTPSPTPVVTRLASDGTTPYGCPGRNSQTNSCIVEGTYQGIGYHDCVDDTQLSFSLSVTGLPDNNNHIEIWAGTSDCTQSGATHNGSTGVCWPVANNPALSTVISPLNIRVADIVSGLGEPAPPPQTFTPATAQTACGEAAASSASSTTETDDAGNVIVGESTVTIYFMVFANAATSAPVIPGASYSVKVKLVGPSAVSDVDAGAGDGLLIVTWTPPTGDTTIQGFDLFASPAGAITSDGGTQTTCTTELVDDAGNAVLDDAGNPIFVDDAGNPVAGADGGCTTENTGPSVTTCDEESGAASIDVSNIECGSSGDGGADAGVSSAGICTQVNGPTQDKGNISGVTNGTSYAVAVAAFDEFGNTGAISNAACDTPKPIKDFWTLYNDEGGSAFCALSVIGKRGGGVAAGLLSLVGMVWLRRRRRSTRR